MTYYRPANHPLARRRSRPLPTRGARLRSPVVRGYGRGFPSQGPIMMLGDAASDACDAQGRAAQQQFQDAWTQMDHAWNNTTGLYTIGDMQTVFDGAFKFVNQAMSMLDAHRATYGDTGPDFVIQALNQAYSNLFTDTQNGLDFARALSDAKASNATVVNAPGFKSWVASMMIDAGTAAYVVTYVNACEPTGAATIIAMLRDLITFGNDLLSLIEKAASVAANVAVGAADVVYKTTVGTLTLIGTIVKYLPWVVGGVGALWLWKEYGGGKR